MPKCICICSQPKGCKYIGTTVKVTPDEEGPLYISEKHSHYISDALTVNVFHLKRFKRPKFLLLLEIKGTSTDK